MQHVGMIKRIAAERWEIKYHVQKVLYGAVALPIVKYGAVLWYDVVSKVAVKRNIWALQRALLLLMTKACRTTSTAAANNCWSKAARFRSSRRCLVETDKKELDHHLG